MPYPNSNVLNIVIPQTSASIDPTSTQAPFVERIISGSRLVLQTDTTGTLIGSSDLNVNSITASNISASGNLTASSLYIAGNSILGGDVTILGTSSIVNISSSTIIIGDNRIQLNAFSPGGTSQRYAGLDLTDSGSTNSVTSSLLWDSLNNYLLLTNNQSGSSPIATSSAIVLQGPTGSFGSEVLLTANTFLKAQTTVGNLVSSGLSEDGGQLLYAGTISASTFSGSAVSSSNSFVNNTIYAQTGSFTTITLITGSAPGAGGIPASPTASGIPGQLEVDNNFMYVYTNGVWKRVPLSIWVP